ncbi:MAG: AAA family ATPase [Planctomycetota bacterium]
MTPQQVADGQKRLRAVRDGLGQVILGQEHLLDHVCIGLAARGHMLLEGLPGLGKTELVRTLGGLLGISFGRVQFTPDLLPSDITGGPILQDQNGRRELVFQPGPLFAHIVLADEINRASPKTQAAMLEAMQERHVTVLGVSHPLPDPFFVLATQNPIELEGTYPLPEAQLDRFLFKINVPGVSASVMQRIIATRRRGTPPPVKPVLDGEGLQALFGAIDQVFLPEPVASYIARLVEASHPESGAVKEVASYVRYGASPRAAIAIAEAARASALLAGRPNVDFADVTRVAPAALGHRMVLDHAARIEGVTPARVVKLLLDGVDAVGRPLPKDVS